MILATSPSPPSRPALHYFAAFTAVATLGLICLGGLVTSHEAGMSVPDWPTTYGYNMFYFPVSKWVGGIFYEHTHRLWASGVGLLTAILAGWIWATETAGWPRRIALIAIGGTLGLMGVRTQLMFVLLAGVGVGVVIYSLVRAVRGEGPLRWWAAIAFSAVVIQGVLGGLRVTQLQDKIGIAHAALAQLFFVLLCGIALITSPYWHRIGERKLSIYVGRRLRYSYGLVTAMIFGQLVLGATMRHQHAGLAIPDFPRAYGKWWPDTSPEAVARYNGRRDEVTAVQPISAGGIRLQMAHRAWAVMILITLIWVVTEARRRVGARDGLYRGAISWMVLVLVQAGLGAATIWSKKSADIATAHVAVGAISLVTGALLAAIASRRTVEAAAVTVDIAGQPGRVALETSMA